MRHGQRATVDVVPCAVGRVEVGQEGGRRRVKERSLKKRKEENDDTLSCVESMMVGEVADEELGSAA